MLDRETAETLLDDPLEPVWRALASPWRRRILDLLRERPRPSGELVEELGETRYLVLKHLAVLRDAGLVTVIAQGRERINYLNPIPIRDIYERWVTSYEDNWAAALTGLRDELEAQHAPPVSPTAPPARRARKEHRVG